MKATGIVRRIDDLGRVVIPKEIRRTFFFNDTATTEIYTSNEGEVIFKKYSPVNELADGADQAAEVISKLGGAPAIIFDRDHVVAVSGLHKKEYSERRISPALEELLENRRSFAQTADAHKLAPIEGIDKTALAVFPIISSGDITGAVAFMSNDDNKNATEQHKMLAKAAAMFLGKQIEE